MFIFACAACVTLHNSKKIVSQQQELCPNRGTILLHYVSLSPSPQRRKLGRLDGKMNKAKLIAMAIVASVTYLQKNTR